MAEWVGLNAQAPDFGTKLSQLLSIRGQQQGLRGQAAQVQQEEQNARQRKALAEYDWNKHVGEDGTIDLNSLHDPELMAAAGDQYLDVVTRAVQAKGQQLESRSKLVALRNDQREAFAEMMGGLRSDRDVAEDNDKGRQKVNQAFLQYGEMYGEDSLPVLQAYAGPLQKTPKGRMSDALRAIQLQAHSATAAVAAQQPQYANTGGELTQVNPNAAAGGGGIPLTIAPGFNPMTDPRTGNSYLVNQQTGEVRDLGQGYPGTPPGAAPGRNPSARVAPTAFGSKLGESSLPAPFYPGQAHDLETQQQEVQNVRAAADNAPLNRNIYRHVLKLADDTTTGQLTSWAQANPVIGQMFGDNYQELGKYLEKNAIANMQAMGGPPSDARLSAAVAANGSTSFNAKALKAVTQFNYATNSALERYRQGVDKAIGTTNPKYSNLPQFKAEWAKNFDVDAFRLENAIADGDERTKGQILNGLSPTQARALMTKMKNLDSLAETGKLPQ